MESISITTHLQNNLLVVKAIKTDEMKDYFQNVTNKHRQNNGCRLNSKDIVGGVSLTAFRMLRQTGKVWDQLNTGDQVWLVTTKEWNYYSREVLERQELHYRLGKKLVYRSPSTLSTVQLKHFIETFYHDNKPKNPLSKYGSPTKVENVSSPKSSPVFSGPQSESKSNQFNIEVENDPLRIYHNLSPQRQQNYNTEVDQEGSATKVFIEKIANEAKSTTVRALKIPSSANKSLTESNISVLTSPSLRKQQLARTNSHRKEQLQESQHLTRDGEDESSPRVALDFEQLLSPMRSTTQKSHRVAQSASHSAGKASPLAKKDSFALSTTSATDRTATNSSSKIDELTKGRNVKNYYEYRKLRDSNNTVNTNESPRPPRSRREMLHTERFEVPLSEYMNAPHSPHITSESVDLSFEPSATNHLHSQQTNEEYTVPVVEIDLFHATFTPQPVANVTHVALLDESFHDSDSALSGAALSVTSNGSVGPTKRARRSRRRQKKSLLESATTSAAVGAVGAEDAISEGVVVESFDLHDLNMSSQPTDSAEVVIPVEEVHVDPTTNPSPQSAAPHVVAVELNVITDSSEKRDDAAEVPILSNEESLFVEPPAESLDIFSMSSLLGEVHSLRSLLSAALQSGSGLTVEQILVPAAVDSVEPSKEPAVETILTVEDFTEKVESDLQPSVASESEKTGEPSLSTVQVDEASICTTEDPPKHPILPDFSLTHGESFGQDICSTLSASYDTVSSGGGEEQSQNDEEGVPHVHLHVSQLHRANTMVFPNNYSIEHKEHSEIPQVEPVVEVDTVEFTDDTSVDKAQPTSDSAVNPKQRASSTGGYLSLIQREVTTFSDALDTNAISRDHIDSDQQPEDVTDHIKFDLPSNYYVDFGEAVSEEMRAADLRLIAREDQEEGEDGDDAFEYNYNPSLLGLIVTKQPFCPLPVLRDDTVSQDKAIARMTALSAELIKRLTTSSATADGVQIEEVVQSAPEDAVAALLVDEDSAVSLEAALVRTDSSPSSVEAASLQVAHTTATDAELEHNLKSEHNPEEITATDGEVCDPVSTELSVDLDKDVHLLPISSEEQKTEETSLAVTSFDVEPLDRETKSSPHKRLAAARAFSHDDSSDEDGDEVGGGHEVSGAAGKTEWRQASPVKHAQQPHQIATRPAFQHDEVEVDRLSEPEEEEDSQSSNDNQSKDLGSPLKHPQWVSFGAGKANNSNVVKLPQIVPSPTKSPARSPLKRRAIPLVTRSPQFRSPLMDHQGVDFAALSEDNSSDRESDQQRVSPEKSVQHDEVSAFSLSDGEQDFRPSDSAARDHLLYRLGSDVSMYIEVNGSQDGEEEQEEEDEEALSEAGSTTDEVLQVVIENEDEDEDEEPSIEHIATSKQFSSPAKYPSPSRHHQHHNQQHAQRAFTRHLSDSDRDSDREGDYNPEGDFDEPAGEMSDAESVLVLANDDLVLDDFLGADDLQFLHSEDVEEEEEDHEETTLYSEVNGSFEFSHPDQEGEGDEEGDIYQTRESSFAMHSDDEVDESSSRAESPLNAEDSAEEDALMAEVYRQIELDSRAADFAASGDKEDDEDDEEEEAQVVFEHSVITPQDGLTPHERTLALLEQFDLELSLRMDAEDAAEVEALYPDDFEEVDEEVQPDVVIERPVETDTVDPEGVEPVFVSEGLDDETCKYEQDQYEAAEDDTEDHPLQLSEHYIDETVHVTLRKSNEDDDDRQAEEDEEEEGVDSDEERLLDLDVTSVLNDYHSLLRAEEAIRTSGEVGDVEVELTSNDNSESSHNSSDELDVSEVETAAATPSALTHIVTESVDADDVPFDVEALRSRIVSDILEVFSEKDVLLQLLTFQQPLGDFAFGAPVVVSEPEAILEIVVDVPIVTVEEDADTHPVSGDSQSLNLDSPMPQESSVCEEDISPLSDTHSVSSHSTASAPPVDDLEERFITKDRHHHRDHRHRSLSNHSGTLSRHSATSIDSADEEVLLQAKSEDSDSEGESISEENARNEDAHHCHQQKQKEEEEDIVSSDDEIFGIAVAVSTEDNVVVTSAETHRDCGEQHTGDMQDDRDEERDAHVLDLPQFIHEHTPLHRNPDSCSTISELAADEDHGQDSHQHDEQEQRESHGDASDDFRVSEPVPTIDSIGGIAVDSVNYTPGDVVAEAAVMDVEVNDDDSSEAVVDELAAAPVEKDDGSEHGCEDHEEEEKEPIFVPFQPRKSIISDTVSFDVVVGSTSDSFGHVADSESHFLNSEDASKVIEPVETALISHSSQEPVQDIEASQVALSTVSDDSTLPDTAPIEDRNSTSATRKSLLTIDTELSHPVIAPFSAPQSLSFSPDEPSVAALLSPADSLLQTQLERQSLELQQSQREKKALEARLEETRYLLQMFAGLNGGVSPMRGGASTLGTEPVFPIIPPGAVTEPLSPAPPPPAPPLLATKSALDLLKNSAVLNELESTVQHITVEHILAPDDHSVHQDSDTSRRSARRPSDTRSEGGGGGGGKFSTMYRDFKEGKNRAIAAAEAESGSELEADLVSKISPRTAAAFQNSSHYFNQSGDESAGSAKGKRLPYSSYVIKKDRRSGGGGNKEQRAKALSHINHKEHPPIVDSAELDQVIKPSLVIDTNEPRTRRTSRRKTAVDSESPSKPPSPPSSVKGDNASLSVSVEKRMQGTPSVKLQLPDFEDEGEDSAFDAANMLPLTKESLASPRMLKMQSPLIETALAGDHSSLEVNRSQGVLSRPTSLSKPLVGVLDSVPASGVSLLHPPVLKISTPSEGFKPMLSQSLTNSPANNDRTLVSRSSSNPASAAGWSVADSEDDGSGLGGQSHKSAPEENKNPLIRSLSQWTAKPAKFMKKLSRLKFRTGSFISTSDNEFMSDPSSSAPKNVSKDDTFRDLPRVDSIFALVETTDTDKDEGRSKRTQATENSSEPPMTPPRLLTEQQWNALRGVTSASPNLTVVSVPTKHSSSPSVDKNDDSESVFSVGSFASITSKDINNIRIVNRRGNMFPNQPRGGDGADGSAEAHNVSGYFGADELIDRDDDEEPPADSARNSMHSTTALYSSSPRSSTRSDMNRLSSFCETLRSESSEFMEQGQVSSEQPLTLVPTGREGEEQEEDAASVTLSLDEEAHDNNSHRANVFLASNNQYAMGLESPLIVSTRKPLAHSSLLRSSHQNLRQAGESAGAHSGDKKVIHITEQMYEPRKISPSARNLSSDIHSRSAHALSSPALPKVFESVATDDLSVKILSEPVDEVPNTDQNVVTSPLSEEDVDVATRLVSAPHSLPAAVIPFPAASHDQHHARRHTIMHISTANESFFHQNHYEENTDVHNTLLPFQAQQRTPQKAPQSVSSPLVEDLSPIQMPLSTPVVVRYQSATDTEALREDPLFGVLQYFRPFLVAEKYLSSGLTTKGINAYHSLHSSVSERELILFIVFQIFGTPDGVLVRNIKMTQVSRCLKDASLATILASQLDLMLTKIPSVNGPAGGGRGLTASGSSASLLKNGARPSQVTVSKTGTVTKLNSNSKTADHSGGASNQPSFQTFYEVMHLVAQQIAPTTGKGKAAPSSSRTKPSATVNETTMNENMQFMENKLRAWLQKTSLESYERLLADSQTSLSGILLKSCYKRHAFAPTNTGMHSGNNSVAPTPSGKGIRSPDRHVGGEASDIDVELTRLVWERNSEQTRQIYAFYASSLETRRVGSGPNKLLASLENCKEMLVDFQVVPGIINAQDFNRIFRTCKLWEWRETDKLLWYEQQLLQLQVQMNPQSPFNGMKSLMRQPSNASMSSSVYPVSPSASNLFTNHFDMPPMSPLSIDDAFGPQTGSSGNNNSSSFRGPGGAGAGPSPNKGAAGGVEALNSPATEDPYDFKATVGNLSLSLCGFMELLTRIACHQHKLGSRPHEALENLMHLMDASNGKAKIIGTSRKSVAVRHFIYAGTSGGAGTVASNSVGYMNVYK